MTDTVPTLEQFIEPVPIKFTFDAPGWHVLAAGFFLCIIVLMALALVYYYKNRYRRICVKQLRRKSTEFILAKKYAALVYTANMLMKQICITLYGRDAASDLRGKAWLEFLNQQSRKNIFDKPDEKVLDSIYQSQESVAEKEALEFAVKAKRWIMKHKHVARRSK